VQDADWRKRHAALICLSQVAEGCVKVLQKNLPSLADMCLQVRACSQPRSPPRPDLYFSRCRPLAHAPYKMRHMPLE
jgi:hypothetical protein